MVISIPLGPLEPARPIVEPVVRALIEYAGPMIGGLFKDPKGYVTRIGDLIVWQGESGQKVLAGLTTLGESQKRVADAISHIEIAQRTMAGTLGFVQAVSMATLGITAFSATAMLWRLTAIKNRLDKVNQQLQDLNQKVDAQNVALVASALDFFSRFKHDGKFDNLQNALENSNKTSHYFGQLAHAEATTGPKRLPVLNYCNRFYVLSFMTELWCRVLGDDSRLAEQRIKTEQAQRMQPIAVAMFQQTIGKTPELYLEPGLKAEGVTLDLLTETYQQAHVAGVPGTKVRDADQMFEDHLRIGVFKAQRSFRLFGEPGRKVRQGRVDKLRYLLACLEDFNRIEALRLLISKSLEGGLSILDLEKQMLPPGPGPNPLQAYAFV